LAADLDRASPADRALADAEPGVFWTQDAALDALPSLSEAGNDGGNEADLLVIGGGFTGLWAAIEAKLADPARSVVLVEGDRIASGASGRNGGFISESLTHGLAHGMSLWPQEMPTLLRMGRENLDEIDLLLQEHRIDASLQRRGKSVVALSEAQFHGLEPAWQLAVASGEDAELLDLQQARADVHSPTYAGALRVRTGSGTVHPGRLAAGLAHLARALGVAMYERSAIASLAVDRAGLVARTGQGKIRARRAILATNASPPLLRRLRMRIVPVLDHVLVTEPLTPEQRTSIGWLDEQGLTDPGNRFHYYRVTPDGRILFGGYDATYHFRGASRPDDPARMRSYRTLATHFIQTFPQLEGLRFSHRWFGAIDTTSRFTPFFGTAYAGRLAYAVGFTGLGVGSSRFAARIALDLADGQSTERTRLQMVRRLPVPFPPEPLRYPVIRLTQAALEAEDRTGRRGAYLRLLDRLKVGFAS